MRVVGVILARIDSLRLPGKALLNVDGLPLIGYAIERAKRIKGLSNLVLATTARSLDDPLVHYAERNEVEVFRGSLEDVSNRIYQCARHYNSDYFLRINGDSPFLDPAIVEEGLGYCSQQFDLISNIVERTFPYGISVEAVRTEAYECAIKQFTMQEDAEHVTQYFYRHTDQYNVKSIIAADTRFRFVRLVVDNSDDLLQFQRIVKYDKNLVLYGSYTEIAKMLLENIVTGA